LKNSSFLNLNILLDIKCEDICLFSNKYRFKVTYVFLSLYYNTRFFVTYFLTDFEELLSLSSLYRSAAFLEREL
jgi:NADH:ubiquinone oxidoreductase subunit C